VNRKLTEAQVAAAYAALVAKGRPVSGRALRAELQLRYGAVGKTARVFALCRALRVPEVPESTPATELRRELGDAQRQRLEAIEERDRERARAERSELREIAHQDRWANEIHELRRQLGELQSERARRQALDELVVRLQREVQSLQRRLARYEG